MQWLIDIVKEWIQAQGYLLTSYVDRGDPDAYDFTVVTFSQVPIWHDLDLSAIVPAGAKSVLFTLQMNADAVGKYFYLRKKGQVEGKNVSLTYTQVADIPTAADIICAVDEDRKVQYLISPENDYEYSVMNLTVKGWWV